MKEIEGMEGMLRPDEGRSNFGCTEDVLESVCPGCVFDSDDPPSCVIQAQYGVYGWHPAIVGMFAREGYYSDNRRLLAVGCKNRTSPEKWQKLLAEQRRLNEAHKRRQYTQLSLFREERA